MQLEDRGGVGLTALSRWSRRRWCRTATRRSGSDRAQLDVPRRRAAALRRRRSHQGEDARHPAIEHLRRRLQAYLGSAYVNDFNLFGRTYQVRVQAEPAFRVSPDDIKQLEVRNPAGQMVPLATLVDVQRQARTADHQPLQPLPVGGDHRRVGARLQLRPGALAHGADGSQRSSRPRWATSGPASSYQEKKVGSEAFLIFGLAVLLVYLVLAAQYESWSNPAAVVLVVPARAPRHRDRGRRCAAWTTTSTRRSASCC